MTARHDSPPRDLTRSLVAEALGTGLLIIAVVGSGIMAETLSPTDVGLQLLENAIATGGALVGLILMFATVSGAQFNPIVTLMAVIDGALRPLHGVAFAVAQTGGGIIGALTANAMFGHPAFEWSTKVRSAGPLWFSEAIAAFGLVLLIASLVRTDRGGLVPFAVGAWITGAYWFTSSTSFANPAVTVARMFSDSFAGIKPSSAPMFIVMQIVGALVAIAIATFLYPPQTPTEQT